MNDKLLTISIAAYNIESSLERTLSSLEIDKELMSLLDIIIVDDGSSDRTAEIASAFAVKYPGSAKVITKLNGGYGSTVNTSLQEARGRYFKLLDGDDTYDMDGLAGLLEYIGSLEDRYPPDLIITPFIYERPVVSESADHSNSDSEQAQYALETADRHPELSCDAVRLEDARITQGLMMFELCIRTDVLRRSGVRLTEHCYYTDNEYVAAAELYSSTAARYPQPVYIYSLGVPGQSMSVSGRRHHLADKVTAMRGVFDIYDRYVSSCNEVGASSASGTRALLINDLLVTMVREVYVTFMILEDPVDHYDELMYIDARLKASRPDIYRLSGRSRLVRAARHAGKPGYGLLCRKVLRDETRRTASAPSAGSSGDDTACPGLSDSQGSAVGRTRQSGCAHRAAPLVRAAEYAAAICMIVQCRTIFMHLQDIGMIVNRGVWLVMMAALAVVILCRPSEVSTNCSLTSDAGKFPISRDTALLCISFAIYALIFILVNPINYLRVIRCTLAVIMMIVLVRSDEKMVRARRILRCIEDVIVVIASVSLICWVMSAILHILPCTGDVWIDWSKTGGYTRVPTFMGIYYETQGTGWKILTARNTGIFTEGPMAGWIYSVALLIRLYLRQGTEELSDRTSGDNPKGHGRLSTGILVAAILSTLSYTCYFMLFLICIIELLRARRHGSSRMAAGSGAARKVVIGVVLAGAAAFLGYFLYSKICWGSGSTRLNDFAVGLSAWLAHPVFGGGFESLEYLQSFMPSWRMKLDTGFSNSPMEILAQGGIYLGAMYIYGFIRPAAAAARRIRAGRSGEGANDLLFMLMFALLFVFTVVPYQYITFYIIIFMCEKSRTLE